MERREGDEIDNVVQKLSKADRRKQQKREWFEKNKNKLLQSKKEKRSLLKGSKSVSGSAIRKRKQRVKELIIKENCKNRKRNEREQNKLECEKRQNCLEKKREYQKRKRASSLITTTNPKKIPPFSNKMRKHRAIKKLRQSLPDSPGTRISTLAAYLRNEKSPTIKTLQSSNIISSPEENNENQLGLAVLEDMKIAISETKLKRTDQARLSMNVLSASVSGNCVKQLRSKLSLAKKLGVPARRISSGFTLRNKISKTLSSSHVYTKRKVRTDALSDANKNLIHDFWCSSENSHPTGNKNDVKRVRIGPKKYSSHHVQILEKTQSEVYIDFKNKYPSVKVCQSLFERCKPYFVRAASTKDRVTCCCRYHLEMKHVFKAAMNNRKKCNQNLPSDTQFPVYASVTDMCNATLCNPNESGFHDKKCLDRNCPNCGVKLLNFSNEELKTDDSSENINWECFEYINQNTKHGPKKKLMLVKKNTNPGLMVQYLQKLLGTFPAHNFRAKWQNNQLKHLVTNLPQNHVISVHDYSENYKCKERDELQSSYFQKTEASLHVSLLYRHAILEVDGVESTPEDPYIVTENFFVISEDEKHDQYFTFQVQKYISEYLSSISYHVHTMHEFCDGCSCQYKSRHCLGHLRKTLDELGYDNLIRNFFETSHAKGPQDAAGGLIKNQTDLAIVRGRATIQNAHDLFEFAKSNLSVPKSSHNCKRRLFKYTENINRNFRMFYKPIPGIRSVHQVVVNNDHLLIRSLSCYTCNNCLEGNIIECENTNILGSFSPIPIVPEIGTVEEDQTDENNSEVPIYELVCKSTIFAVLCDDDECDYYLLKAQTESYQLTSRETDNWGVSYPSGTKVIKGLYFMQGENPLHFKMIKRKYGLVPSNSCLYICTDVCVRNGAVKLSEDIHQNILKCVEMSTYVL